MGNLKKVVNEVVVKKAKEYIIEEANKEIAKATLENDKETVTFHTEFLQQINTFDDDTIIKIYRRAKKEIS